MGTGSTTGGNGRRRFARVLVAAIALLLLPLLLQLPLQLQPLLPLAPVLDSSSAAAARQEQGAWHGGKQVAIVIDDFGNRMNGTEEMLQLPFPITVAVMPFLPSTKQDAELAHSKGYEVIVHLPLEPVKGKPEWLGPGGIKTSMDDDEVRKRVEQAIDDVPYAVGMNNHMGSKVTADERVMRIILQVCKERGLYFLDSRTTFKTVVPKVSAELQVPALANNIFLDDIYSQSHVAKQLGLVERHLGDHDVCIAIGHVGPPGKHTAAALRQASSTLAAKANMVTLSQLLPLSAEDKLILP